MTFFQCKYTFSNENMSFYINKRRRTSWGWAVPSSEQLKLATNFWLASLCSNNLIIKMKLKRTSQERWWLYICFLKALKIVSKCPHQARPVLFKNCLTLSVFGLETGFFLLWLEFCQRSIGLNPKSTN